MLIIWDMDGTLINSLPSTLEAINDALHPYLGRRLKTEEITKHFGVPEHAIIARLIEERAANIDPVECYAQFLIATTVRLKQVEPFSGIPETLDTLASYGHRFAIFTGRGRKGTDIILSHLGMQPRFVEILTADEVENSKPHPEGIQKLCKKLGSNPAQTLMIGDTPMDILAARGAGVRSIGCTWDHRSSRKMLIDAGATHVIDSPAEIPELLR